MLWWAGLAALALALAIRLWQVWPRLNVGEQLPGRARRARPCRTLLVLGSGGHSGELLPLAAALPRARYAPRLYVLARSDAGGAGRVAALEGVQPAALEGVPADAAVPARVLRVTRAREVGQSLVTSVFTTLLATLQSVYLVFAHRPELILCNGPAICVPFCVGSLLLRVVYGASACRVVFVESGCRVTSLSVSGRIIYHLRLADCFLVQWERLRSVAPSALYLGRTL